MKRTTINAYQIGLVFENGVYRRMLTEGRYRLASKETVEVYEKTKPFTPSIELNILLKDAALAESLEIVDVKDGRIVLLYENGLLARVLTTGRYAFWKGLKSYEFVGADISKVEITEDLDRTTLMSAFVAPYVRTSYIEAYEKAVLFIDGKYTRTLDSGFYTWWKNNISINIGKVDTRMQQLEINGQEILTRDISERSEANERGRA